MSGVRRREFIAGLGSVAAWPLKARTQQAALPVIGYLNNSTPTEARRRLNLEPFLQGLAETGFVDGRTVTIESRWAEDRPELVPLLVTDLVRLPAAVIVTMSTAPTALAAKMATQTIPVAFLIGADPIKVGLVTSLARPGGNITGFTVFATELTEKRFELLRELVPTITSIALLFNPTNIFGETKEMPLIAAGKLGLRPVVLTATHPDEFEAAFATLIKERAGALVVGTDALFNTNRDKIIALAARHRVPTMYFGREAVLEGGLIAYAPRVPDSARAVGVYAGRLLKGEKPADLPVQQPTKFDLVINLKTAKALGLDMPPSFLALADEVIE
jgi:putative tryptophan/tyrosine transport system substrate-binding protein